MSDIQKKISSTKNIQKITKAMQTVAASKMKKSQKKAFDGRPFAIEMLKLLRNISEHTKENHFLLQESKEVKKICCLIITTNKGLCGGLNANVVNLTEKYIKEKEQEGKEVDLLVFGKKGKNFFNNRHHNLIENTNLINDEIFLSDVRPIAETIIQCYLEKKYDLIRIIYSGFVSTFQQDAVNQQVLPIKIDKVQKIINKYLTEEEIENSKNNHKTYFYKIEPTEKETLDVLLDNLIRVFLYQAFVESRASEHSARMMAMKNASDNADDVIKNLNLKYNKFRQAKITQEIAEISSGVI